MKLSHLFRTFLLLVLLVGLYPVAPVQADPPASYIFNVNTIADTTDVLPGDGVCASAPGVCSLRAAIVEANALGAGGTQVEVIINLERDTTYIPETLLMITADQVSIQTAPGSGAKATISSTSSARGMVISGELGAPAVLKVYDVRIANGKTIGLANNFSALWLDSVILENLNYTSSAIGVDKGGGAIYNKGHLEMTNCTVRNNSTNANGGAILNNMGTFNIQNSTFTANSAGAYGGAIYNISSSNSLDLKHIFNSIFENNTAGASGGAIYINGYNVQNPDGSGSVYIKDTRISNNQAVSGGGISISDEFGLVLSNAGMNLVNSEISGNIALSGHGGGLYFSNHSSSSQTNIENSTISGNEAFLHGGGIYIANDTHSTITLFNTTITDNAADRLGGQENNGNGGGFYNASDSTLYLRNSIVAGNHDLTSAMFALRIRDCVGSVELYYSLLGISQLSFCDISSGSTGQLVGTSTPIDALLGDLMEGNTVTRFHTPLVNSPAIDSADPAGCFGAGANNRLLVVDQNYEPRPFGPACDMGAKEYIIYPIFLPTILR